MALAIVWACEHFDMYLRGASHFQGIKDHKFLTIIWKRPKSPLKIERLDFQPYTCTLEIVYGPGKDSPADFVSRHPIVTHKLSLEEDVAEQLM